MPDTISERLLARVDRSLRRRLSTDARPHLERVAALARTDEEFLAGAARLLANPRERETWLASWLVRRPDADDSAPAPLDAVGLPAPATNAARPEARSDVHSSAPAPLAQQSFRISPAQLDRLRDALAHELGPIASLVVEAESARSAWARELLTRLQAHLDTDPQRARFVQATLSRFPREV